MNIKKIISGALVAMALPCAFVATSCGGNADASKQSATEGAAETPQLKIAYVMIDTLTNQYNLYQDAVKNFQEKQANAEATINQKGKSFQNQVQQFENKARANQLTQEQFNNEQARLAKVQQDLQDLQLRLSNSLQEEYQKELQALTDTIKNFMASYAQEKGFDFILCKSSGIDNVLYAKETYDVTEEVVAALNKRYETKKTDAAKTEETK